MVNAPVRRIERLTVKIHVPQQVTEENRERLERAARSCPVHKSLHPEVQVPLEFTWG
jgi:putative redox protein